MFFKQYSDRARMVVFAARYRSGKNGAAAVDTNHLIEAIILEDQGKLEDALESGKLLYPTPEPHPPFFSTEAASEMLLKIEQVVPHNQPIPESEDMPLSDDLVRTFEVAETL